MREMLSDAEMHIFLEEMSNTTSKDMLEKGRPRNIQERTLEKGHSWKNSQKIFIREAGKRQSKHSHERFASKAGKNVLCRCGLFEALASETPKLSS